MLTTLLQLARSAAVQFLAATDSWTQKTDLPVPATPPLGSAHHIPYQAPTQYISENAEARLPRHLHVDWSATRHRVVPFLRPGVFKGRLGDLLFVGDKQAKPLRDWVNHPELMDYLNQYPDHLLFLESLLASPQNHFFHHKPFRGLSGIMIPQWKIERRANQWLSFIDIEHSRIELVLFDEAPLTRKREFYDAYQKAETSTKKIDADFYVRSLKAGEDGMTLGLPHDPKGLYFLSLLLKELESPAPVVH